MHINQYALYSLYRWSQFIVSLIGSVVLSRKLGPEGFVLSGVVLALQAILTVIVEFGYLDYFLVNKSKYSTILSRFYNTSVAWAAVVSTISLTVAWILNLLEIGVWAVMFICMIPFKSIITIKLVLKGNHNKYAKKLLFSSVVSYFIVLLILDTLTVQYVVLIRALLEGLLFIFSGVLLLQRFRNVFLSRGEITELSNSMSVNLATTILRAYDRILFFRILEPITYGYAERVINYSNIFVLNTMQIYTNIVLEKGSKIIKNYGLIITLLLVLVLETLIFFTCDLLFKVFLWIHGDKWSESFGVFKIILHVVPPTMGIVLIGWSYKLQNMFNRYAKELWLLVVIHLVLWSLNYYIELYSLKYYILVLYFGFSIILARARMFLSKITSN